MNSVRIMDIRPLITYYTIGKAVSRISLRFEVDRGLFTTDSSRKVVMTASSALQGKGLPLTSLPMSSIFILRTIVRKTDRLWHEIVKGHYG